MALASMMMWAGYTVLLRVRRDSLSTIELLVMVCAFGAAFMLPWVLWEILFNPHLNLSPPGFLAILYSAIGSLLLAYAGWSYVVRRLGAARAGVTMHLMPGNGRGARGDLPGRVSELVSLRRHRADPRRRGALLLQSFIGRQYPVSSR
jgi:branched-subunit amino acid ABC-type transport system permease component